MDHAVFLARRTAFNNLLDSPPPTATAPSASPAGVRRTPASSGAGREAMIDEMTGYYIDTRLRSARRNGARYC